MTTRSSEHGPPHAVERLTESPVFSIAGNRNPAHAGQAIARVAGMGYAGFLVGPVLIGGAAQLSSLRLALTIPVLLTLFVATMAYMLQPRPGV